MAPHMMRHRSAAAMAVFDGQIYALGGHDGLSIFDSVSTDILFHPSFLLYRGNGWQILPGKLTTLIFFQQ